MLHSQNYKDITLELFFQVFLFTVILYGTYIFYRGDKIREIIQNHVRNVLNKDTLYDKMRKTGGANDTIKISVMEELFKENFKRIKDRDEKIKSSFIMYISLLSFSGIIILIIRSYKFKKFIEVMYGIFTCMLYLILVKVAFIHNIVNKYDIISEDQIYNRIIRNINKNIEVQ